MYKTHRDSERIGGDACRAWTGLGVLLAFLLCPAVAWAQAETGQIVGTVKDPQGAVIAGANITVKSLGTNATRQITTGSDGTFVLANLLPAVYEVSVEASGFATRKQQVQLTVGGRVGIDLTLEVGGGTTVVEVVGESGIVVNTESQTVGSVVTEKQIRELPTITRNPYELVALSGNASPGDPSGRNVGFAINGQRAAGNNVLLDGASNNDEFTAGVGQSVPLDSVQEYSILTSNFTAEFGRATGGVVNLVTKSGTNEFHGTVYEFNRNSDLASNSFDNKANGIQKGFFNRNQFGYSIGGPIVREKLFFFNSTEWIRVRSSQDQLFLVPTDQFIAQTATETRNFFNAYRLAATPTGRVFTRAEVPSTSPTSAFGRLAATLPVFQQVRSTIPTDAGGGLPQNSYQTVSRIDYNISEKTSLYGRYALESIDNFPGTVSFSPYDGFSTGNKNFNNNVLVSLTRSFTPNFVSQSKVVFNRLNNQQPLGSQPEGPTLYMLGATTARVGGFRIAYPGYLPFAPGSAIPFGGPQNFIQIYEDLSYTRGKHEFRFGGSYTRILDNRTFGAFQNSVQTLGTGIANAMDNLVLGQVRQYQGAIDPQGKFPGETITLPAQSPSFTRNNRYNEFAFYGQDSWRVTPRLRVNLGLRYEYYGVQKNENQRLDSNFYFGQGSNIFEQIRNGRVLVAPDSPAGGLWRPDRNNFAPRVGFAWDVFGDGKTSLRGGYGINYERNFGNVTFNVIQNPPNYAVISITAPVDVARIPISNNNRGPLAGTGTRTLPGTSLRHVNENIRNAYAHVWSASIQRELFNNLVVALEYSGSKGEKLYSLENPNILGAGPVYLNDAVPRPGTPDNPNLGRLNRQYTNINTRSNNGFSNYNGLTVSVDSRNLAKSGIYFTARNTWSKAIDNLSSTFSESFNNFNLGLLDPFNPDLDRGPADFDIRHRFVTSGVWEIPFAKNLTGWKKQVAHGWQVNYIFQANTGTPFSFFDSTNSFAVAPRVFETSRISRSGADNPRAVTDGTPNRFVYLDFSALNAGAGSYFNPKSGTSDIGPFPSNMTGRNAFRRPGFWNLDMSLAKRFFIGERYSLQLRVEAFNLLNRSNLFISPAENDIAGIDFMPAFRDGRRNVQLAAKFIF